MADTLRCMFVLGPCAAREADVDVAVLRGGSVACGGAVYYVRRGTANPVALDFAPNVERAAITNAKTDPRALFVSWSALMRTLAYTVPAEVTRARGAVARLRKAVR